MKWSIQSGHKNRMCRHLFTLVRPGVLGDAGNAYPHSQALRVDEDDCRVDIDTNRQNLGTLGGDVDDLHSTDCQPLHHCYTRLGCIKLSMGSHGLS